VVDRLPGDAADLQLTKAGSTTLVAARRWKASNHGVEPLRALARARAEQDASHCTYVSLVDPGDKTRRFAANNRVDILTGPQLVPLVRKLPLPRG
jgi:restriction system protein